MILNSFFIIPLLTHILDTKEVSIYLIALQILNLICTCSFDWIAKGVIRFYEKYDIQDKLNSFLSTVFWLSIFVYILMLIIYFSAKNLIITQFAVSPLVFILTIILVIPCGIRQILYQILRAKNYYWLYTGSIILYQLLFVAIFLAMVNILPDSSAIITAMIMAIAIIDIYISVSIAIKYPVNLVIDKKILFEILKYALPLVVTSVCYWTLFHSPKLIFQSYNQYLNTSVFGIAWTLATNTLQPAASLFMFVNFPVIIKNHEHNKAIRPYFTSMIQMYIFIMLPLVMGFGFFSQDIVKLVLPSAYSLVSLLLPLFRITIFLHELMKLINIKYHLTNKTYIETVLGVTILAISCIINLFVIQKYSIIGAAAVMLLTEITLIVTNNFIKFKNSNYINYNKVFQSFFKLCIITLICYLVSICAFSGNDTIICILKLITYFLLTYTLYYIFRKKILL